MKKHLIRVDGDDFSGWCRSHCTWGMTTPLLATGPILVNAASSFSRGHWRLVNLEKQSRDG
jgi:hypothetical protein